MLLFHILGHAKSILYIFYFISLLFFILSLPVFLPFLNASSVQKWKKTKIYKSEYRAGDIMQWFCRAIKLCIISVKIDTAIMVKVTFEKVIFSLNKVKKVLLAAWVTFFCDAGEGWPHHHPCAL